MSTDAVRERDDPCAYRDLRSEEGGPFDKLRVVSVFDRNKNGWLTLTRRIREVSPRI